MKFKKCCLIKEPTVTRHSLAREIPGSAIPSAIIDDVLNCISSLPDDELVQRLDMLAESQPNLCAFITPLSNSLPSTASFPAALAAFAIIWMFEQHHQHHQLRRL